jgi:hypothetical protein
VVYKKLRNVNIEFCIKITNKEGITSTGMRVDNHKREYPSSVRMNNNQGLTLHGDKMGFTTTGY